MTKRATAAAVWMMMAVAACSGRGGENPDPNNQTAEVGSSGTTLGDPSPDKDEQAAPNVTPITRPEQTIAAGRLSPVNNSGVTGSVNVRGMGEQTELSMNVTGIGQGNQQLQGTIVQGTCEQSGTEVTRLVIPVGAGNIATLTDTLQIPVGTVLNGQHALLVKGQNAGPATPPLACSPLPDYKRLPPTG